jgi:hypothetical protein
MERKLDKKPENEGETKLVVVSETTMDWISRRYRARGANALFDRLSRLSVEHQCVVLEDLEEALSNRIAVFERLEGVAP